MRWLVRCVVIGVTLLLPHAAWAQAATLAELGGSARLKRGDAGPGLEAVCQPVGRAGGVSSAPWGGAQSHVVKAAPAPAASLREPTWRMRRSAERNLLSV
jgi:hypothetical protein